MKTTIRSLVVLFILLLLNNSVVYAQQFKWVKGGGTNQDLSSEPSYQSERTEHMCTDPDGNVYALSQVGDNSIFADTFIRLGGAYGSYQNILLTSYNCNGQMRWAKLIASNVDFCRASGIIADSVGHIYVSGLFTNNTLYIGYDTTIAGLEYESSGLIQFDTSGHFNWIRYVGDNIHSNYLKVGTGPLVIDAANNVHELAYIGTGVYITPTLTSIYGNYELVYNSSGTLISSVRLDLDSEWYLNSFVIDPVTNKLYTCGQINQGIYGGFLTDTFFAAAFDASRHLIWQYFCGHGDDNGIDGVTLDQSKHLHFSGGAQSPITDTTRFVFNGDSVSNTVHPLYSMAVVLTTDTNGHPEWIKHFDGSQSINSFASITQLSNNKVAAAGGFIGNVTNGSESLTTLPGYGASPYFVVLDSSGNLINIQQALCDATNENTATVITSDKVGNLYFGGIVVDSIYAGTITPYVSVGGNTDFFVTKYGVDCSCISAPTASFTDTGTHHTIGVTYTGTTTGLDSVVWNFGDGHAATGPTNTHTYPAAGTYHVCVTTYTECGIDESCRDFVIDTNTHVLVGNVTSADIRVYPNPSKDELNISGLQVNTMYQLFSITGASMQKGTLTQGINIVSMRNIASGIYILEMTSDNGGKNVIRVIKE